MHEPPYRTKNFVVGAIILWFGAIAAIPSGWVLCNGDMGTPNLMDRWIVGAGDTYAVGDTGGRIEHYHTLPPGADIAAGADYRPQVVWKGHRPPYHALCYIMKVN